MEAELARAARELFFENMIRDEEERIRYLRAEVNTMRMKLPKLEKELRDSVFFRDSLKQRRGKPWTPSCKMPFDELPTKIGRHKPWNPSCEVSTGVAPKLDRGVVGQPDDEESE